jgi:cellulose synthase/poly-beta-1,6-N-acetylglucosamine synthase-like glycosyltransferase
MTSFLDLLRALLSPIVVLAGAMSLALWWRSRFWAPIYIHLIAASSTLIASLLVWMAWIVDDPLKARALWLVSDFSGARIPDIWVLWRQNHEKSIANER